VWPDGSGLSVTDEVWADRQPGTDAEFYKELEDCARAAKKGNRWQLYDEVCDRRCQMGDEVCEGDHLFPFVCQIDSLETNEVATVTSAMATTASVMPDCDYKKYRAVHTPMTHADATASCRAQGGDLASLPTSVQAGMIGAKLKCASSYWIGATDQATEGTWLQPDGSTLPTDKSFGFWGGIDMSGGSGGEHCAMLGLRTRKDPTLHTAKCSKEGFEEYIKLPFICAMPGATAHEQVHHAHSSSPIRA